MTPQARWCFFRHSDRVRTAVKFRMKERNLTNKALAEKLDIKPYRISKYLNNKAANLNQFQLYKLCEELGIGVKIVVEFK